MMRDCKATEFDRNAVLQAILVSDFYERWSFTDTALEVFIQRLKANEILNDPSRFLPVGSVEFLRQMFDAFGLSEPEPMDYPVSPCADAILGRRVKRVTLSPEHAGLFVKPVQTKLFDAGVMPTIPKEIIGVEAWVSPPIRLGGEWRAYVQSGEIIGIARYDDLDTEYPEYDLRPFVERVIDCVKQDESITTDTYAVDIGMVNDQLVLVELNDAWATGYYTRSMTQTQYLSWLHTRWLGIVNQVRQ